MSELIVNLTDDNFEGEALKSSQPVIVDFWGTHCGPCKMLAPIFEEVSNNYAGKVTFAKLDVENNPASPLKYGIRNIPALLIFKDGEVVANKIGVMKKAELKEFIDSHI